MTVTFRAIRLREEAVTEGFTSCRLGSRVGRSRARQKTGRGHIPHYAFAQNSRQGDGLCFSETTVINEQHQVHHQ